MVHINLLCSLILILQIVSTSSSFLIPTPHCSPQGLLFQDNRQPTHILQFSFTVIFTKLNKQLGKKEIKENNIACHEEEKFTDLVFYRFPRYLPYFLR